MSVLGIIIAIIFLCILIIGHEFGHFITAKMLNVKVLEFSMGMGPQIWHRQKGETEYSLRALPLGGFCRLEGEDNDSEDERSFSKQPAWAKILILLMGSVNNVIIGLLILTILFTTVGFYTNQIGELTPGMPAAEAGMLAGDRIVAVDGTEYDEWPDIVEAITSSEGQSLTVVVERKGERLSLPMTPEYSEEYGKYMLGMTCKVGHSPFEGAKTAFATTGMMFVSLKDFFVNLFAGDVSSDDVVGIVGVMSIVGEQAQYGLSQVFYIIGIISINLAAMNLLPIPALDGGRIFFILLRKISGGRISENAEAIVNGIGFIILMIFMVFLIFKDTFTFIL